MQLRHFTSVIRSWLWLILVGTVLCAGATYAVSKASPHVYEASALIQVNDPASAGNSGVFNDQALAVSDALQVTGNSVLKVAAKQLPGVTTSELSSAVSAAPLNNTQIIEIRVDAPGAQLAANIANTVAKVFIQQQIAAAAAIDQSTATKLSSELVTAKANVDTAQAELLQLQDSHATQAQITNQSDILNNYQVNYASLFSSYNQIQLQLNLINNSLSITQPAVPPTAVKSPRTSLNTIIAAALGLLLTIAFALLLDWLDTTIKTSEDVAQLAMLAPLGSVPLRSLAKGESLINETAVGQAFVTISTNFKVLNKGKRIILVTSQRSGTGTSITAAKLASALAQSGMKVLLIDANLYKPVQHELFKFPNTRGLPAALGSIDALIQQPTLKYSWLKQWETNTSNLFLLPAGPQIKQVETLQLTTKLQQLVDWVLKPDSMSPREEIDLIIVDTPALDTGPDTIAMAPVTDGTILVIEAGKERAEALQKVQVTFERLDSPIVGVVVNRQQAKHRSYFYAHPLRQDAVFAETPRAGFVSKYPPQQVWTFPSEKLPVTPLPMNNSTAEIAEENDIAKEATLTMPNAPGATKVQSADDSSTVKVNRGLIPPHLKTNGFWPEDNQGRIGPQ
jgi:capsular exopolysaccharide synthesis family protein